MLKPGDKAPDFTLTDQDGNTVSLTALLADGPLLLYFYPADFTPGCTRQACTFRDMHDELTGHGMRVVGISPQDAESHAKFRSHYALPFPLLADPDKQTIKAYGCDGPLGLGVRRVTYRISREGVVEDALTADFRIGRHADFARNSWS